MMLIRLLLASILGGAFTVAVFWLLWTLVSGPLPDASVVDASRIEFTRMRRDTDVASLREQKVAREEPPPPPELPRMTLASSRVDNNVATLRPVVDARGALTRLNLGAGSDTDVIPLVRIPPEYPARALSRGLEGEVTVQFTITETGATRDIIVVSSTSSIFESAAVRAVERYRYNPKVEGGVPVERVGIQVTIVFELEDAG